MDKDSLTEKIETAFRNFRLAIEEHADINKKRADGGWTVGQIGDHIVKGTNTNLGATKKEERPYDKYQADIRKLFLNFKIKFPVAPTLKPDEKNYSKDEIFSSLDNNKEKIFKMIITEDLTETCVDIRLPVWGHLTKYEWLVLFESHMIRHTKQVNDFNTTTA